MRYYTARALGRVLGMGEEEILSMTRRGLIRQGLAENGLYTIEEAAREIIAALNRPEEQRRRADYQSERARLMRTKRLSAEYELGLQEGDLHRTDEIELAVSRILVSFKSKIRSIPSRAAPQCAKLSSREEIFDLLKRITDEALQELAGMGDLFGTETEEET